MKVQTLTVVAVLAGFVGMAAAQAQDGAAAAPKEPGKERHMGGDGGFAAADANKDGVLSLDEFKAMDAARLEQMKARMGDKFDPERVKKMPSADERFVQLDKDANGSLTKDELAAGRKPGERRGPREGRGPDKNVEQAPAAPPAPEAAPAAAPAPAAAAE